MKSVVKASANLPVRPARWFTIYAWSVLIYHLAVILWGAVVRSTGSGAGCGEHWPLCNGTAIPPSPTLATMIEFSHRFTSGMALTLSVGLLIFAFRLFPAGHLVRRAAVAAEIFELMEAVIGAALVLLGQVARNTSTGRGYTLSAHSVNTLLLLAALTVAAWGSSRGGVAARAGVRGLVWAFAGCFVAILAVAVSGTIAALGDTLFRASSLVAGFQQDMAAGAHPFLRLRIWHPFLAVGVALGLGALCYGVIARRVSARATRLAYMLSGLVLTQIAAGMVNLALLAPIPMQLIHLLLADTVWITFVVLGAEVLLREPAAEEVGTLQERDAVGRVG